MKTILLTLALAFITCQYSTAQVKQITYVSLKKDTLILPNNDLGKEIHSTWESIPKKERPVILFDTEARIQRRNKQLYVQK